MELLGDHLGRVSTLTRSTGATIPLWVVNGCIFFSRKKKRLFRRGNGHRNRGRRTKWAGGWPQLRPLPGLDQVCAAVFAPGGLRN